MTQIIAVAMQKGGVGKTTTTINLAAALTGHGPARPGCRPGPAGQPDPACRLRSRAAFAHDLRRPEGGGRWAGRGSCVDAIYETDEGFHLLPSQPELSLVEVALINTLSREQVLATASGTSARRLRFYPHRLQSLPGPAGDQRPDGRRQRGHPHPDGIPGRTRRLYDPLQHRNRAPQKAQSRPADRRHHADHGRHAHASWPRTSRTPFATSTATGSPSLNRSSAARCALPRAPSPAKASSPTIPRARARRLTGRIAKTILEKSSHG